MVLELSAVLKMVQAGVTTVAAITHAITNRQIAVNDDQGAPMTTDAVARAIQAQLTTGQHAANRIDSRHQGDS